jgi:hypothetical protein
MNLERTQTDFVKTKAKDVAKNPKIGKVVEVFEHRGTDDDSNFEVDVTLDSGLFQERGVPYTGAGPDHIEVPRVGDTVELEWLESEGDDTIATDVASTNLDRPPVARSGMYRNKFESDKSPVGRGSLHITGYTEYSKNPAVNDYRDIDADESWIQIAKHLPVPNPADVDGAPMVMQMYDSPKDDKANITIKGNQVDGDDTKSLEADLDFKTGEIVLKAKNSTGEFGVKFNAKDGTFTLIDESGYGIESDGSGNFTWHYETINHNQGSTTSL